MSATAPPVAPGRTEGCLGQPRRSFRARFITPCCVGGLFVSRMAIIKPNRAGLPLIKGVAGPLATNRCCGARARCHERVGMLHGHVRQDALLPPCGYMPRSRYTSAVAGPFKTWHNHLPYACHPQGPATRGRGASSGRPGRHLHRGPYAIATCLLHVHVVHFRELSVSAHHRPIQHNAEGFCTLLYTSHRLCSAAPQPISLGPCALHHHHHLPAGTPTCTMARPPRSSSTSVLTLVWAPCWTSTTFPRSTPTTSPCSCALSTRRRPPGKPRHRGSKF